MRIEEHPILQFPKGKKVMFYFEGKPLFGYEGEPIAVALHDNGVMVYRHSIHLNRPRGFYCAIGHCASCFMVVNGKPNTRVCITPLKENMDVRIGKPKDKLKE